MRIFIIPALAASLALAGCTTFDDKIRQALAVSCPYLEEGHETFVELVKLFPEFEAKYSGAIKAAYDPAHEICINPEAATTLKIALTVGTAAVRIYRILSEIEQSSPAAMEVIAE